MTQASSNDTRKHYGPLAEQLIGAVSYGKGAALDTEIGKLLIERDKLKEALEAAQSENEELRQAALDAPEQGNVSAILTAHSQTIRELCEAMATEHKMTRLLFGTVMQDTDNDDAQLRELVEHVIDNIYENTALLDADQRDLILQKQDDYLAQVRQQMERGTLELEQSEDHELER